MSNRYLTPEQAAAALFPDGFVTGDQFGERTLDVVSSLAAGIEAAAGNPEEIRDIHAEMSLAPPNKLASSLLMVTAMLMELAVLLEEAEAANV